MRCAYLPLFLGLIPTLSLAMESPTVAEVPVGFNGGSIEVPEAISPDDTSVSSSPASLSSASSLASSPSSQSRSSLLMVDEPSPLPGDVSNPSFDSYVPVRGRDLASAFQDVDDAPLRGRDLVAPKPSFEKGIAWTLPGGKLSRYQQALKQAFNDTTPLTPQKKWEAFVIRALHRSGEAITPQDRIEAAQALGHTVRFLEASPQNTDVLLARGAELKELIDIANLPHTTQAAQRALALLDRANDLAKNEYCISHPTNRVCAAEHQFDD